MELFIGLTVAVAAGFFIGGILWIIKTEWEKHSYKSRRLNRKIDATYAFSITQRRNDRGVVLVMVLIVSMMMLATASTLVSIAHASSNTLHDRMSTGTCLYAAEAAVSRVTRELANGESGNIDPTNFSKTIISATTTEISPGLHEVIARGVYQDTSVTLRVYIENRVVPLFQYATFFEGDLEIQPGPNMTLAGPVHTNGNMHLGAGNTLTIDSDYCKSSGKIYLNRKDNGNANNGDIEIKSGTDSWGYSVYSDFEHDSSYFDWDFWVNNTFNTVVEDDATKASVPGIEDFQYGGYYHTEADVVVVDNTVFDGNGTEIGTIAETTLYDPREDKNITVSEIDMATIPFPANGLLYAFRTGADANQPDGIRLINGSEVSDDITVVTEGPIYIKGDFNSVNKKSCAIIADAVNLLSNAYDDLGGTMQDAVSTTYNVSFVTGNVSTPDGGGRYSGGFENLPRFHEDWRGVVCNMNGSFNCLFESSIAKSAWGSSNVYSPPIRAWGFDQDLTDVNHLPPFTPTVRFTEIVFWSKI